VHNNDLVSSVNPIIVIDVEAESLGGYHAPIKLGSFIFTLNDVKDIVPSNDDWVTNSKALPGIGSVEISLRRRSADKRYILQKQREIILSLTKQIGTIETLNEDADLLAYGKMSGNVRGIGGVSLLHVAIELVDTEELIQKLLDLEADPLAQSIVGTPMEAAENLYARSEQKLDDAKKAGKPSDVLEMHRQRYLQTWRVRELLRTSLKDNEKDDESSTQKRNGKSGSRRVRFALVDTDG
jgi:hypothetical protein